MNPYRYRGYYYDTETNLYYLINRYYSPELCRFISADDVTYLDPERINGLNLYAYCGDNPVMRVDPEGTFLWTLFFLGIILGFIIGAVGSAISQGLTNGWGNINWFQVFFDGLIGAAIGGVGGLTSVTIGTVTISKTLLKGIQIAVSGALGFVRSVGDDLIQNNFDWGKVNWLNAIVGGLMAGATAAIDIHISNIIKSEVCSFWVQFSVNVVSEAITDFGIWDNTYGTHYALFG